MCNQESRRLTCVHGDEDDSVQPPGVFYSFIMRVKRKSRNVPVLLLTMVLTSFFHAGHSVWSFNVPHQVYIVGVIPDVCLNLKGLTREQLKICAENSDYMTSVGLGVKMAIDECKFQFQYRRWNCSIPEKDSDLFIQRITIQSTREAAFTYAISSAGVLWALARSCSEGNLSSCPCSREVRPKDLKKEYLWGGCGDNIEYGAQFGKQFMDAGEKKQSAKLVLKDYAKMLMNLHNRKIGREVVQEMSVIECKCHGVSGSCSLTTCWRQLKPFREVGNALHDKYDSAVHVELKRKQGRTLLFPKGRRRNYRRQLSSPKNDLVYLEPSPDFCIRDPKKGTLGTRGRKCIKDAPGTEGCKLLCCDKGYNKKEEYVEKRCRCKFYWCCQVRCKVCRKNVTTYTCK